jgi:hypothetical protein
MSASAQMVNLLSLQESARAYGLPFLRDGTLEEDGLRVSYTLDPQSFYILRHVNVIRPGGNRIKASQASSQSHPTGQTITPPATPAGGSRSGEVIWSDDSDRFIARLIGVHLPGAIWDRFPVDRKTSGRLAKELRGKPLSRAQWPKIVEPLNAFTEIQGKFLESVDRLLPANWTTDVTTGDFGAYNRDFLQRIRDHLASKPAHSRAVYSAELRRRIRAILTDQWDYLPLMHSHKMWTFTTRHGKREYRICPRRT